MKHFITAVAIVIGGCATPGDSAGGNKELGPESEQVYELEVELYTYGDWARGTSLGREMSLVLDDCVSAGVGLRDDAGDVFPVDEDCRVLVSPGRYELAIDPNYVIAYSYPPGEPESYEEVTASVLNRMTVQVTEDITWSEEVAFTPDQCNPLYYVAEPPQVEKDQTYGQKCTTCSGWCPHTPQPVGSPCLCGNVYGVMLL